MKSIFLTAALVAASAAGQGSTRPTIEVATIRLNTGGGRGGMRGDPGRFTVSNTPLRTMIRNAYKAPDYTISGGPAWMNSDRYDIEAKVDGELKGDDLLFALKTLLEDRFQLKVHRETKEGTVYLLTAAKGGPKLSPSNCIVVDPAHMPPAPASGEKVPEMCGRNKGGGTTTSRMLNIAGLKIDEPDPAATVPGLTFYLSSILERTVIDKTGLTGRFDVHLEYTPQLDGDGLSIFTAVQEQLGLKLESAKGPVETLVVDRVERPSAN
jgi:uncharacterized protein (TIGR03435 family)